MTACYVHTLGDSTLDNLYWVGKKEKTVEGKLRAALGSSYKVVSHAYDGFTTQSLLTGDHVGRVLQGGGGPDYLAEKTKNGRRDVKPLLDLQEAIKEDLNAEHYVVLSVGGNDFRENLLKPWRLLSEVAKVQKRYLQIVEKLKELPGKNIRPILMFQYRTDANDDPYKIYTILGAIGKIAFAVNIISLAAIAISAALFVTGVIGGVTAAFAGLLGAASFLACRKFFPVNSVSGIAVISALIERFYKPILEKARKDAIPILDLPNTFNPHAPLYTCGIEPNENGGALIAEGLAHIITKHDFQSGSTLYAKTGAEKSFHATENAPLSQWRVK